MRHPLVLGFGLILVSGWSAMAADQPTLSYEPEHEMRRVIKRCPADPGRLFQIKWDDVRCPNESPGPPWEKWNPEPPVPVAT